MSASVRIRVLSVDDHPLLREGISAMIKSQPDMELVAEASTGREGIERFRQHQPDITLMDLRLPDMSGIEAMAAIRAESADGARHHPHHLRG
jgi:DNA-binding NarL/FixJ family response regulator